MAGEIADHPAPMRCNIAGAAMNTRAENNKRMIGLPIARARPPQFCGHVPSHHQCLKFAIVLLAAMLMPPAIAGAPAGRGVKLVPV